MVLMFIPQKVSNGEFHKWRGNPTAEIVVLEAIQCEFKSHSRYQKLLKKLLTNVRNNDIILLKTLTAITLSNRQFVSHVRIVSWRKFAV